MNNDETKILKQGYIIEIAKLLNMDNYKDYKEIKNGLLKVIEILDKIIEMEDLEKDE